MNILSIAILGIFATLSGPDGRMEVRLASDNDKGLFYSVFYDGSAVLEDSRLGLRTDFADFRYLEPTGQESSRTEIRYSLDRIKTSRVAAIANRTILHFRNPDGVPVDIEWHIGNNDAAFRYVIPRESETGSVRVMEEYSSFRFPGGSTSWLCPQSDPMTGWKRTKPSYEEYYRCAAPVGEASEFGRGFTFPCLFRTPDDVWALVSETGVDGSYCGSHLSDYGEDGYAIAFPMAEENNGNGTVEPAFALPGSTPWRTLTAGSSLAPIAETTIAFDVVEPKYESRHEYDYGKSTWSWILWQDESINIPDQIAFIDLASEMNFPYTLVDAFWDKNIGRTEMERIASYAASKGVDLFLWYSSSGWWNDISQSPTDIMSDPIRRKKEMQWLREIGVKGIKVDFFGGDKQETMRLYESILSDADDHGLMVIFHGCTIPRGWERMYPNYVGSEAVRASENLVFSQYDCDIEAVSACLHPFIRNSVGSMEFGGTFLNRILSRGNGRPDADGQVRGTVRRTTDAFELATAVLFQNPIQNFAIAPNNLHDAPAEAIGFLREVPTVWDETVFIDGMPGEYAVIARRHGDTWYVGAVNAAPDELVIDPSKILGELGGRELRCLSTGDSGLTESKDDKKPLAIPKNDGAVIIIRI